MPPSLPPSSPPGSPPGLPSSSSNLGGAKQSLNQSLQNIGDDESLIIDDGADALTEDDYDDSDLEKAIMRVDTTG